MKRIILMNTNMEWGGGEKWHLEAGDFLKANGYKVEYLCNPHSKLAHEGKKRGFKVQELDVSKLSFLNPLKKRALERIMSGARAVIMNLPQDFKIGTMAASKAGVKRIVYRRGMPHPIKDKPINKRLFANLTHVIANSEEVKKSLLLHTEKWFPKEKIVLIPNGLDLERLQKAREKYYQRKEGEIVLGNAGRLVAQKGQADLIKICAKLKEQDFKFHLLIAGYGELENELQQKIKEAGLSDKITMLGHVKNMPKFFNTIDYFVFPSRFEGSPNTLLEAMAYGKVCFAYDVSAMPEVLDYTNGYLSPLADTEDMAYKIAHHDQESIGVNAKKTIEERFDYQKNMQKLLDILK